MPSDGLNFNVFNRVVFTLTIRVSEELLKAIRAQAKKQKTTYQKFIREALERILKKSA